MGRGKKIKELLMQVETLTARAEALAVEKAALTESLSNAESEITKLRKQTPEALERVLSGKSVDKARELLKSAMARSKQIVAEAEEKADGLLRDANEEAEKLRSSATGEMERDNKRRLSRIGDALALLSRENEQLTHDICRQSIALMSALCEATDMVLRFEAEPDESRHIFEDSLAEILKASADETDAPAIDVSTVKLGSRTEFDSVGSYGFRNNALITRAILSAEGIAELPESFFFGCSNLSEATLPMSMEKIGAYAFFSCVRLQTVLLPRELEHIGAYAFSGCSVLSALRIPGGVKDIGVAAFRNCTDLSEIVFDVDGCLRELGNHAFQNCSSLTACALPEGITVLPTSLFYGCERLERMDIPVGITRMEADVFAGCASLRSVRFHNADILLQPGATEGLRNVQLTLAGKAFAWAEVTEPVTLRDLIGGLAETETDAADGAGETVDAAQDCASEEDDAATEKALPVCHREENGE